MGATPSNDALLRILIGPRNPFLRQLQPVGVSTATRLAGPRMDRTDHGGRWKIGPRPGVQNRFGILHAHVLQSSDRVDHCHIQCIDMGVPDEWSI